MQTRVDCLETVKMLKLCFGTFSGLNLLFVFDMCVPCIVCLGIFCDILWVRRDFRSWWREDASVLQVIAIRSWLWRTSKISWIFLSPEQNENKTPSFTCHVRIVLHTVGIQNGQNTISWEPTFGDNALKVYLGCRHTDWTSWGASTCATKIPSVLANLLPWQPALMHLSWFSTTRWQNHCPQSDSIWLSVDDVISLLWPKFF